VFFTAVAFADYRLGCRADALDSDTLSLALHGG
jgi:hypothetical protein